MESKRSPSAWVPAKSSSTVMARSRLSWLACP